MTVIPMPDRGDESEGARSFREKYEAALAEYGEADES